jgi:uncharacterized membrane protein
LQDAINPEATPDIAMRTLRAHLQQQKQLFAGSATQQEPAMADSVEESIEIGASPDVCYQVATTLDDYPKWVASLESVQVLDQDSGGLAKQAKFAVGAFGKTLDYTLQYTHEVPRRVSWKAIAGSVKALVGSYAFEAIDGGKRTRVTYKLSLDPGFPIPHMIKKASTKLIVDTALSDLRKFTEKPDTLERVQKLIGAKGAQGASASASVADTGKEERGGADIISAVFSDLSVAPVAAASLAEVYKGTTRDGTVVAIKIQRPGLERKIALDFYVLLKLLGLAQRQFKISESLEIVEAVLDEVGAGIFKELDFRQEAAHIAKFQASVRKSPLHGEFFQ